MRKIQNSRIYQTLIRNKWFIFLFWSLWVTVEYFGLGPFSYLLLHEWGDSYLPVILGIKQEVFKYGLNYWSNVALCGADRLSMIRPFSQIDIQLYLALPPWLACGLVAFLQRFIAGYFTYRLCRDYLKLDELPSLVAGFAYPISFFYFQSGLMGEAGFPFILWSLEHISERKNVTRYILSFLLGVLVLLASYFGLFIPFI